MIGNRPLRDSKTDRKGSGPLQQKSRNQGSRSSRPQETEHTKMHREIPQTLIDKRKRWNQCSRCGQTGHYCAKCPSATPVVASSRINRKRGAGEAGYEATRVSKSRHIEAPPKPAVKQVVPEVRGSPPPDLDILEIDTDMDSLVRSIPRGDRNAKANSTLEPRRADEIDDGNEAVMFPTRSATY